MLELEKEKTQERLKASDTEETKASSMIEHETKCDLRADVRHGAIRKQNTVNNLSGGCLSMKLNVISGQTFGMVPQGSKIQSIISVARHQVIKNLS